MRHRTLAGRPLLLLAALPSSLVACSAGAGNDTGASAALRSAVLITLDTTNPNALDIYGRDRGLTPNLERLAGESVVYEQARAVAPLTMPSHTSMLTGLYPPRHTVRDNGWVTLPSSAETLAERARAAGYHTGAFVGSAVLRAAYGLDQGFEVYDESPQAGDVLGALGERAAQEVTRAAVAWLDGLARDGDGPPYFLWVHYFDPHMPYRPPPEHLQRAGRNPYLGEMAAMDAAVGALLGRLRREPDFDESVVVVVADHGEGAGRHGELTHGLLAYDSTLRVPFFVRFPERRRAGERSGEVVSVVDVFPTLLAAMGLPVTPGVDGLDLGAGAVPPGRGVYFENYYGYLNYGWSPLAGWADSESKYVHGARPELFLSDDEGEAENRFDPGDPRVQRARDAIEGLMARPALERAEGEGTAVPTDLLGLGYAGGASPEARLPHPLESVERPAPQASLEDHYEAWSAFEEAGAGRLEEAIARLREVVRRNPDHALAAQWLGELQLRAGRPRQAVETLEGILERGFDRPNLRQFLTRAHLNLGEPEPALAQLERYLALCPGDREAALLRDELRERLAEEP